LKQNDYHDRINPTDFPIPETFERLSLIKRIERLERSEAMERLERFHLLR
jgi:hypothetical protein